MPLFVALCGAHHNDHHTNIMNKSLEIVKLHEKLEQNPPRCKYQEAICEEPENEYPRDLIELIIGEYEKGHQQDTGDYTNFFDNFAQYMKWMYETGFPRTLDQACNMQYEEVFFPKVASTENDTVFIVQKEPYIIRKVAIVKCLGSKDGTQECFQNYEEKKNVDTRQNWNNEAECYCFAFWLRHYKPKRINHNYIYNNHILNEKFLKYNKSTTKTCSLYCASTYVINTLVLFGISNIIAPICDND